MKRLIKLNGASSLALKDVVGQLVRGLTPRHQLSDVGAKHLGDYLLGNPAIFISKCFALAALGKGEAFG